MDIYETILDACWKHYWDSMEDDKAIIIDHIEGVLAFVKSAQQSVQSDGAYCECIEPFSRAKVIDGVCSFCRSPRR